MVATIHAGVASRHVGRRTKDHVGEPPLSIGNFSNRVILTIVVCILVAVLLLFARGVESRHESTATELLDAYAELRLGMTKADVERIVGMPHNMDTQFVWMWGSLPSQERTESFRDLYMSSSGAFLLFDVNARLLSLPTKNAEASPWVVLRDITGDYIGNGVESMLGPRIHIIGVENRKTHPDD